MVERRKPGQIARPLSAADHNMIAAAADDYQRRALANGLPPSRSPHPKNTVIVKNMTGGDLREGDVVELFELLIDEQTNDAVMLEGDTPENAGACFGILKEHIKDDATGVAQVSGVVARTYVNVTDEDHDYAAITANETVLQSAASGSARIISKPSGTGEKLCVVLLGGGSSTPCDWIEFFIDQVDPVTNVVTGVVTAVPAGCTLADVPGVDIQDGSGQVLICDPRGCDFNEPEGSLNGRYGQARYVQHLTRNGCQDTEEYLVPHWIVTKLCCPIPDCS